MDRTKRILIISSPTASGKSDAALQIAAEIPVEIISADSRQIYKQLTIGTAKPGPEERHGIPHHFIDELDITEPWNAGKFSEHARERIRTIFDREKVPLVVGGTGLYIAALVDGIADMPETDPEMRERLRERLRVEGLERLAGVLRAADPDGARQIDLRNPRRVLRALEIYYGTGMTRDSLSDVSGDPLPFPISWYGLDWDRAALYKRIDRRVERMVTEGLVEEVRGILESGCGRDLNALQSVGYAEVIDYLDGKTGRDEMIDRIKRNTRRYAKRQTTWFRKEPRIEWIRVDDDADIGRAARRIIATIKKTP
jgi:tRNA dimethylallyltransferase